MLPRGSWRTFLTTFVLLCAGCAPEPNERIVLILRHGAPPEQPQHRALLYVAQLLQDRTDGRITFEVEALSLAGSDIQTLIKENLDELSLVSMAALGEYYRPMDAFEAPYMFRDLDHFYATVESQLGQDLLREVERRSGIRVLDVWHQGIRQVTLIDRPATTPEEFGEIRLRVPPSAMFVEAAKIFGALPTTIQFNSVYETLRARSVDGQENPLPTIKAARFHEVCDYLVITNHMIGTIMPVVSQRYWDTFSPDDQRLITEAFRDGRTCNRRIIEEEEQVLVEEFRRGGMTVLRPDLTVFRKRAEQSWRRFHDVWGDSLVERIQAVGGMPDARRLRAATPHTQAPGSG